jgi:hypothetical protein
VFEIDRAAFTPAGEDCAFAGSILCGDLAGGAP